MTKIARAITLHKAGNLAEAEHLYREELQSLPSFIAALHLLGVLCGQSKRYDEGKDLIKKSLALSPENPEGLNNLGTIFLRQKALVDARACYEEAIRLRPHYIDAILGLFSTFQHLKKFREALCLLRESFPNGLSSTNVLLDYLHTAGKIADWDGFKEKIRSFAELVPIDEIPVAPFPALALPLTCKNHLQLATRYASKWERTGVSEWRPKRRKKNDVKIRLGYFSADFRMHAASTLIAEVLELHDKSKFDVIGYSFGPNDGSSIREAISKSFMHFHDVNNFSDEELASKISDDEIDILIDLTGYTEHSKSEVLAYRPAPLQVSWFYPSTMGASFVDYFIADEVTVPKRLQDNFSEKIIRLPHCYMPSDRRRPIGESLKRSDYGLPADAFVFCCFAQTHKISPDMFDVWMNILRRVPKSVLWLFDDHQDAISNIQQEALKRGVETSRIVFAPRKTLPMHLARYKVADLALDTFPYGSHTTGVDALWVGCPLLTIVGDAFPSRVAASLLKNVGLDELAANDASSYLEMAVALGNDPSLALAIRSRLQRNRDHSPLFDMPRFTKNLEMGFQKILELQQNDQRPRHIEIVEEGHQIDSAVP